MNSFNSPSYTFPFRDIFLDRTGISVPNGAVLLYGIFEQRSEIDNNWLTLFGEDNIFEICEGEDTRTVIIPKLSENPISLREQDRIKNFVNSLGATSVYIDVTGLSHHIWMPLLRFCMDLSLETSCIYVEPGSYTHSPNPKPGEFFDLSERILGFSPIPTFARLTSKRSEEIILVPLLGFEGVRFRHLVERIEPSEQDLAPIVGVPGFELEYPFHTFECNASVLSNTRSWQRVRFADAACPFALFGTLSEIYDGADSRHLQIATIGTKPHALGAVLFAMKNPDVELLYDHPRRRRGRTSGASKCHLYYVTRFFDEV